jgi:hypothetical protein
MSDADTIRNLIRRGHRTSGGRQLRARWRPVYELEPGDVLAGLRAGSERTSATGELERALKSRTWANVVNVDADDTVTRLDVTTRMDLRLSRSWRNLASLPVLELVSHAGQPVDSNPTGLRTMEANTTAEEATMSDATESRIFAEAETLANLQAEDAPTEADFAEAEATIRDHYENSSEPFFSQEARA